MKKKIVLSLMLIVSLFMITGCGSKKTEKKKETKKDDSIKEIVLKDEGFGTTTFKYDKDKDYEVEIKEGGKYKTLVISSEKENFEVEIYHTDTSDDGYNSLKESRSNTDEFKEYTWNKYNGYSYDGSKTGISFNILLKDGAEAKVLFGEFDYKDYKTADVSETFKGESVQKLLNSITFKEN